MLIDTLKPPTVAPSTQPVRAVITSSVMDQPKPAPGFGGIPVWLYPAALLVLWAFFPTLDWMVSKWIDDPSYSHGFLVPLFSGYLIYLASQTGVAMTSAPRPILAALVLLAALPMRLFGGGLLFHQLDVFAFLLTIYAGVLAIGGTRLARVVAPAALFLIFMIPLPYEIEQNVGGPLKTLATNASTFALQTIGYPAVSMGNVIYIDEATLGVVDQCSGLKMLLAFSAFAVGAVLLQRRSVAEQFFIVLGFVPISIFTNVLRITATGIIYAMFESQSIRDFCHDLFGFLMMPVGLGFLALQLWVQSRLVVKEKPEAMPSARWSGTPMSGETAPDSLEILLGNPGGSGK